MTGWEKEWPKAPMSQKETNTIIYNVGDPNWNIEGGNLPNVGVVINEIKTLKSQGSNLVDAEAYLYFQCENCDTILDPHTKSFARLQQARVDKGWQCVWNTNGLGYNVYCEKCGEGKK